MTAYAYALERGLQSAQEETLLDAALRTASRRYFDEYEDATEMDPEFDTAFRTIADFVFPGGELADGTDWDELTRRPGVPDAG